MRLTATTLVFVLLMSVVAEAAVRTDSVYDGITGPQLAAILKANGLSSDLKIDTYGDPIISSSVDGLNFAIEFYECDKAPTKTCGEVLFRSFFAGMQVSVSKINQWNYAQNVGQAYLDDKGNPNINLFCKINGGATDELLTGYVKSWLMAVREFTRFIGFVPAPGT